jgi:hypothetical protein
MLTKTAFAAAAVAALSQPAAAFNAHRHLHREVEERQIVHTDWHTVVEVVYVTQGAEQPAPAPAPPADTPAVVNVPAVVEVPAAEVTPVETPEVEAVAAPTPTTLATQVVPSPSSSPETPPASGSVKSKRGMAFNDVALVNYFGSQCESCSWSYNWGSSASGVSDSFQYVPMLWSPNSPHSDGFDDIAAAAVSKGAPALFSFNEPDHASQANMDAGSAAAAHAAAFNKYAGQIPVGSPSITNSGNPGEGLEWLQAFVDACDAQGGCNYDFCNVHWYSESLYADTLYEHIRSASQICGGKPVWLTEFGTIDGSDKFAGFLTEVIPKLEAMEELEAYSYFWVAQDYLMSGPESLSEAGKVYASA